MPRIDPRFLPSGKRDPIFIHGGAPKAHGVYCVRSWLRQITIGHFGGAAT